MFARRIVLTLGLALTGAALGCSGSGGGTGTTPVLTTVQLTPASPTLTVGATVTMVATPLDQTGTAMVGVPAATFSTSDATKASVGAGTGLVTGVAAGTPSITASITSGGVTKTASQTVTVTALSNGVTVTGTSTNAWDPKDANVASVATVQWVLSGNHSVIFDTAPAGALPANIAQTATGTTAQRTLTATGTYAYHCGVHGAPMSGTIIVR
ncbi:MAG: Ig-like domain-containing protein [Gemmatimonadaceae bacterium]